MLPFDCLYSASPRPFFDQPLVEGHIIIAWRVEMHERAPVPVARTFICLPQYPSRRPRVIKAGCKVSPF